MIAGEEEIDTDLRACRRRQSFGVVQGHDIIAGGMGPDVLSGGIGYDTIYDGAE